MPTDYPELTITNAAENGTFVTVKTPPLPEGAVSWTLRRTNPMDGFPSPSPNNLSVIVQEDLSGGASVTVTGLIARRGYALQAVALDSEGGEVTHTDILRMFNPYFAPPAVPPRKPGGLVFQGFVFKDEGAFVRVAGMCSNWRLVQTNVTDGITIEGNPSNQGLVAVERGKTYAFQLVARNSAGESLSDEILRFRVPTEEDEGPIPILILSGAGDPTFDDGYFDTGDTWAGAILYKNDNDRFLNWENDKWVFQYYHPSVSQNHAYNVAGTQLGGPTGTVVGINVGTAPAPSVTYP